MPELVNTLLIVAVIALVVVRQFSAQKITADQRWWVLPGVLLLVAARNGAVLDPRHGTLSVLLLAAGLLVGLVTGAGWGWTARMWQGPDGSVWSNGTKATVWVWSAGLALRASLAGAAVLAGVHQSAAPLLMSLAAMLLARGGVLASRALGIRAGGGAQDAEDSGGGPAYATLAQRKERV
ncbi:MULTISPECIES: DUF1453 family protein [unclassified Streptomyces]|uniref:DUF1453 family protein n=1 Tax=unclassified Streptomyces TaxID=2593676 RepID=UPI0001C19D5D|nr:MULTISPECIES: DUF1453 family protein [unclassified Streptomyces]AEN12818.1 integral membrane protein [Streptomyces sp. SirexAA-E]MYR66180.1 DUF1453 family protein [Streptomyces sp. SID4939]MYS00746.1 DUF1453 family protein [Streptomyces sp. SID4940]MYT65689.1 DUF1453 family protein [Streptomyces sp. SID8357]MYT84275.1 DUF1453 family protein [Streptomyces sp. SID8360]